MQTALYTYPGRLMQLLSIAAVIVIFATACAGDGEASQTGNAAAANPATSLEEDPAESPPADAPSEPEPFVDHLAMDDGDSLTFAVEVVVTEAGSGELSVGDIIWQRNCYILGADGTFTGPGLPEWTGHAAPDTWAIGTWENGWDGTDSSYVGRIFESAALTQTGSVTVDEDTGELQLTAVTGISIVGELLVRFTSSGKAVQDCVPQASGLVS